MKPSLSFFIVLFLPFQMSLGLSVCDRAWEGAGWARIGHGHRRELGTNWAWTGHGHRQAGHGLGGHGQIVFERHGYPLIFCGRTSWALIGSLILAKLLSPQ